MMTFIRTDSGNPDFQYLVSLLDADLAERDGSDRDFYSQFNKIVNIGHCIVCYMTDRPVGCGSFKKYDEKTVEIKRMFVLPEQRGNGVASEILVQLETWALETGYTSCVLETGKKQPEAISLYKKAGYSMIENYDQYKGVANSVCMKKGLSFGNEQ